MTIRRFEMKAPKAIVFQVFFVSLLLIFGSTTFVWAAADNFSNAITLTGTSGQVTDTNANASKEPGEPNHSGTGGASVWWKWTAPSNMSIIFNTYGSSFDTLLAVYTGSSVGSLTEIAKNDDDGSENDNSSVSFNAQAGTVYYIAVDGYEGNAGNITLNWKIPAPPPNDNLANAILISGTSGETTGTNLYATKEFNEPTPAGYVPAGKTVWWRWISPITGTFFFDINANSFYSFVTVYKANLGILTEIMSGEVGAKFQAQTGTEYYIAVDGDLTESDSGTGTGDIKLKWRVPVPPSNDNFSNALTITGESGQTTGTVSDATSEPNEPTSLIYGSTIYKALTTVWWRWTAPSSGMFRFDTTGSTFDTLLAVYTGASVNTLTTIVSNDDENYPTVLTSVVTFQAQAGMQYYIRIDRAEPLDGNFVLNWKISTSGGISGKVSISVAGYDKLSVSNAVVSLAGTTLTTQTDTNGNFTIQNVPAGTYTLKIESPDLATISKEISVSAGQNYEDNSLQMSVNKCDFNSDGRTGLEEVIYILQIVSGIR